VVGTLKKNFLTKSLQHSNSTKLISRFWIILLTVLLYDSTFAQKPYYFHTIHSHGLSFIAGRTAKINYMFQMSRTRQLKISGTYIYNSYDQGRNHIRSNLFLANALFQYSIINKDQFFLNLALGGGGYNLVAKDRLNIKHKEWRFNFVGGIQAEYYIVNNTIALTLDYDILYLPWSKIYEFIHVPTAGITLFFF